MTQQARGGLRTRAAIPTVIVPIPIAVLAWICLGTAIMAIVRSAPIRDVEVRDVEVRRPTPEDLTEYRVPQWVKVVAAQRPITVSRPRYSPMIESIAPDGEANRRRLLWFSFAPTKRLEDRPRPQIPQSR
jgi:hypothetical protein